MQPGYIIETHQYRVTVFIVSFRITLQINQFNAYFQSPDMEEKH